MNEESTRRITPSPEVTNPFGHIFRINAELKEDDDVPLWMELGEFERLLDFRVFVFKTTPEFKEKLGARTHIEMVRLEKVEAENDRYDVNAPWIETARWYATIRILHAKTVLARTLYFDARRQWVVEFYLDDLRLLDILRERGYIA